MIYKLSILVLIMMPEISFSPSVALAQNITGYDLVDAVNALRASQGLEPYQIDSELMAYAQEHSDYQAANQNSTHLHSDGSLPQSIGLHENVAVLDQAVASVNIVVNEIWVDWGHKHIMIDYVSGEIGAGVALSKDGQFYFTIEVRPGEEAISDAPASGTAIIAQDTPALIAPLVTSLPREDGAIIHKVGYGQTLWSIAIAYGVKINDIRRLNNIAGDSIVIYPGQELLIGYVSTSTPTVTIAATTEPTIAPAKTTNPFTNSKTPTKIVTQSPIDNLTPTNNLAQVSQKNKLNRKVFLAMGILGLAVFVVYGFWKSSRGKKVGN